MFFPQWQQMLTEWLFNITPFFLGKKVYTLLCMTIWQVMVIITMVQKSPKFLKDAYLYTFPQFAPPSSQFHHPKNLPCLTISLIRHILQPCIVFCIVAFWNYTRHFVQPYRHIMSGSWLYVEFHIKSIWSMLHSAGKIGVALAPLPDRNTLTIVGQTID